MANINVHRKKTIQLRKLQSTDSRPSENHHKLYATLSTLPCAELLFCHIYSIPHWRFNPAAYSPKWRSNFSHGGENGIKLGDWNEDRNINMSMNQRFKGSFQLNEICLLNSTFEFFKIRLLIVVVTIQNTDWSIERARNNPSVHIFYFIIYTTFYIFFVIFIRNEFVHLFCKKHFPRGFDFAISVPLWKLLRVPIINDISNYLFLRLIAGFWKRCKFVSSRRHL